ncbi:MAG: hypothetical protein ACI9H8_001594 [Lysobacterales bacterium]|jgi:hypothetical protein
MSEPSIKKLPASRGLAWFSGSLILLRAQPVRLLLIGLVLQFLMGFTQMGALGFLLILAIPALTAGVMQSMSLVERGHRPPLMTLFCAFSEPQKVTRLFVLSLVMIAVGALTAGGMLSGLADTLDAELLRQLEEGDLEAIAMANPELIQRLALALVVGLMVSTFLVYFSVPLVWFLNRPAGAAILEGLAGMLRNWLPFLVLSGLLAIVAMPLVILTVFMLVGAFSTGASSNMLTLLMLLLMVAYQLLLFGAQYLSFKEIFGNGEENSEMDSNDGQLIA